MSDTVEQRYDASTETMWVSYDFDSSDTLVPNDELRQWIKSLKEGETPDGQPLEAVNYVFSDEESAEYNHQALAYANVGTYVGSLDDHEAFEPEEGTPSFDTKEDFGIDS